jgi:hypothetical protein
LFDCLDTLEKMVTNVGKVRMKSWYSWYNEITSMK